MHERLDSSNACDKSARGPRTNVADAMQETEHWSVNRRRVFYLSTIDLLIVGPSKRDTKQLRQTDGERFFGDREHDENAEELRECVCSFATLKTQKRSR